MPDHHDEAAQLVDASISRWAVNEVIARCNAELMLVRCDLYADDRASARKFAQDTLKVSCLIATPEQILALRHQAEAPP